MATTNLDIAAEAARLGRLAAETGDPRLARAAAALAGDRAGHGGADRKRWRDKALRAIAAKYFPNSAPWPQAGELSRQIDRYLDRRWCRDQHAATCPRDIAGKLDGEIWALCVDCGTNFYSVRTVHRALSV